MKKEKNTIPHLIIGLGLMFVAGWICPLWSTVTRYGAISIGVLLGTLWLITHHFGLTVPSLLGTFAIVLSGYKTANEAISLTLGNQTTWTVIMTFILCYAVTETGAGEVFSRWMITRKMLKGRPRLFTGVFLAAICILSALVGSLSAFMLAMSFIDPIAKTLGYEEDSRWRKAMLTVVMVIGGAAGAILPFKAGPMMSINMIMPALEAEGLEFSSAAYLFAAVLLHVIFIVLFALMLKPVFHVDLKKMENMDIDAIQAMGPTVMNKRQTASMLFLVIGFAYTIVMIWLPKSFIGYKTIAGIGQAIWLAVAIAAAGIIKVDGRPLLDVDRVFGSAVMWGPTMAAGAFMLIGMMMSDADNGVRSWLNELLTNILGDMPWPIFMTLVVLAAFVCTNFFSNSATAVVLASIVSPFAVKFASEAGVNAAIICAGIAMSSGVAYLTMGAGGVSPIYLGLDCMKNDNKFIWTTGLGMGILYVVSAGIAMTVAGIVF